ncbi:zinc metalloproteinase nas-14-like isoform X2 [Paramacrobiotus metropolitanus]|uniref:zinc metalloproteinase nas-14-like isoform X2 n=1 Tax=Paramacrobiotus metropolitanus TaxID=2943436 RepID=UPI002445DBA0|nr:zinc metalloproteinase nas-14-like isoform X2 [Paramacrobiotus metropolitanus]
MHSPSALLISGFLWIAGSMSSPADDKRLLINDIWDDDDEGSTGYNSFVSGSGYLAPSGYWPNNGHQIPYELAGFDTEQIDVIESAMQTLEFRISGCVTFTKRISTQKEYILIQHHTGFTPVCKADIGRSSGRPTRVKLHSRCLSPGTIQHEILHALGFLHEHNRPDRDDYISIVPGNMVTDIPERNFRKMPRMATFGLPYDLESLLHYGPELSKSPDKPAIVSKVSKPPRWMGQKYGLSLLDVARVKAAYNCIQKDVTAVPQHCPRPVCSDSSKEGEYSNFQ